MGIAQEQKLIIKHTFLEFVYEEAPSDCKPSRQRSWTEPAQDLDPLYGEVRELFHSSDSSDSDVVEEPLHTKDTSKSDPEQELVPATPEVSPLRCPLYRHALLPKDESWESMPAAALCTEDFGACNYSASPENWSNQYVSGGWWVPIPYGLNNGFYGHAIERKEFHIQRSTADPTHDRRLDRKEMTSLAAVGSCANARQGGSESIAKDAQTTVMLRGLPETYSRSAVLQLLDNAGFFGRFNFVYLPVDFKRHKNLGYVLVNLISHAEALRLNRHFEGFSNWSVPGGSACTVEWCSPHQGLQAHVERYRNSPVMHALVPDEWRPLLLAHGVPISFPAPTLKIKAPRLKGTQ